MSKYCPKCSMYISQGNRCPKCGENLYEATPQTPPASEHYATPTPVPEVKKSKSAPWIWIMLGIMIGVVIITVVLIMLPKREPATTNNNNDEVAEEVASKNDENKAVVGDVSDDEAENEKEVEEEEDKPDTDDAEEAVEGFLDAVFDYDFEKGKKYLADEDMMEEFVETMDLDRAFEQVESSGVTVADEQKEELLEIIFNAMSYEIVGSKKISDTKMRYDVVLYAPDFNSLDASEYMTEEDMIEILDGVAQDYGYSYEELEYVTDEGTQQAITADFMVAVVDYVIELFDEIIDDAETISSDEYEITVVYEDGEWLIEE